MSTEKKTTVLQRLHSHFYPQLGAAAVVTVASIDLVYLIFIWNNLNYVRPVLKPLLIPITTLVYLTHTSRPDWRVIMAFLFGWLGDVFLLGKGNAFFFLGLATFLIGHLFYIVAFCKRYAHRPRSPHDLFIAVTFPFLVVGARYLLSFVPRSFTFPVCLYGAVIIGMTLSGHLLACDLWRFDTDVKLHPEFYKVKNERDKQSSWHPRSYRLWSVLLRLGTYLFLFSDFILGISIFGGIIPQADFWVMSTYMAAQLTLGCVLSALPPENLPTPKPLNES